MLHLHTVWVKQILVLLQKPDHISYVGFNILILLTRHTAAVSCSWWTIYYNAHILTARGSSYHYVYLWTYSISDIVPILKLQRWASIKLWVRLRVKNFRARRRRCTFSRLFPGTTLTLLVTLLVTAVLGVMARVSGSQYRTQSAYRQLRPRESSSDTLTGCPISDLTWNGAQSWFGSNSK